MEDPFPSSSFLDHYAMSGCTLTEMLEYSDECDKSSSLGFMELLNMQDFGGASAFVDPSIDHRRRPNQNPAVQDQLSEVLNGPATPNYSSISSESSDGHKDEHVKEEEEEEEDDNVDDNEKKKTKKQLVSLSLHLSS